MATVSSTRPPTSGEASSPSSGAGASELPIADVADWGHLLPETQVETAPPAEVAPPVVPSAVPWEERAQEQALPAPVEAPPPIEDALPSEEDSSVEESWNSLPPELVGAVTELAGADAVIPASEPDPRPAVPAVEHPAVILPSPSGEQAVASVVVDPAQITSHPSSQPLPGVNTPPPESPLPVLLLVDQAQSASGEERQELSRRINRWLDQQVREGGSRHVADWFHRLIEGGKLEGLADAAGHSCHETAVRGLLAMGFPYALEVRPEDLERIQPRESQRRHKKRARRLKGTAAGILVGGAVVGGALDVLRGQGVTPLLTVEVGVALAAMVTLLFSGPRSAARNMGLAVLLVASVLSIILGILGGYGGLVAGLAGLVATLLFALHRS